MTEQATERAAPTPFRSRAAVLRAFALTADAERSSIVASLIETAFGANVDAATTTDGLEQLMWYGLDPRGGAMLATTEAREAWLGGPLFTWIGPGNAAPLHDQIAPLLVAPLLTVRAVGAERGSELSPLVTKHRFSPRADDIVALAISALDPAARPAVVSTLLADAGQEPELLALSIVQCGRALAWSPGLASDPIAHRIVDALLALLHPSRPRPLLELVAHALGPIATFGGELADKIRTVALAGLDAIARPVPSSFAAEVAGIGRSRALPEQDRMMGLPRSEVASACAYILGFGAPSDRVPFAAHRALVLERPEGAALFAPFIDGLIAAAHVPAIDELVSGLLDGTDDDIGNALMIAALLPLDLLADPLVAALDHEDARLRAAAVQAVALLHLGDEPTSVDLALAARLTDPSPVVSAGAARALVARGHRAIVADHAGREGHALRAAIANAALGALDVPVIGELVNASLAELDDGAGGGEEGDQAAGSPVRALLGDCLLRSPAGLELAAELIAEVPTAAGVLALACVVDTERDIGILAPPGPRQALAGAAIAIGHPTDGPGGDAANDADELGALALYTLARMSAGDEAVAEQLAEALAATTGAAGQLVAAFGELRVANATTAAALAPVVGPESPIGARVLSAAVCGRALPADHPAWVHVRELLELGTIARAAAWSALRDRARRA